MVIRQSVLFLFLLACLVFAGPTQAQEVIDSWPSPGSEPRGLAWDGEYLWCADAGTDSVYRLDISDGTVFPVFPFGIDLLYGGITWGADTTIWIANGSDIYEVNPANGAVISSFSCPGG
jgi:hypothetical protein